MTSWRDKWPLKSGHNLSLLYILSGFSFVYLGLLWFVPWVIPSRLQTQMKEAAQEMSTAIQIIKKCRLQAGVPLSPVEDPNLTGLIGVRHSIITTTLGSLAAKRTSTNPNLASLLVYFFHQLGLKPGDKVTVGASASFPAGLVATLAAVKVTKLKPLIIFSLGASQWGANMPQFTLAHIYQCLEQAGFVTEKPLAVTIGGEKDVGLDLPPEGRELLQRQVTERGWTFFAESDLVANVNYRLALYHHRAGSWTKIKAFVNIGGSYANLGNDSSVLSLKPGLNIVSFDSPPERAGVIKAMADHQVPVIHLLYFRGLSEKYGLEWDPIPLPPPGKSRLFQVIRRQESWFLWLNILYLGTFIVTLIISSRPKSQQSK